TVGRVAPSTPALAPAAPTTPAVATAEPLPPDPAPDAELPIVAASLVGATPSAAVPAPGFWVQIGAFREAAGADGFVRRVVAEADWLGPLLATFADATLYRVQAGPYVNRDEARSAAARMREALGLVPMLVERR
ncbi:MAG: SPOR domain-containing protein, partial [Pseudomonadota bacterium]|nr:SPOR domain-containing protein [Pseudomonadota bacterium]